MLAMQQQQVFQAPYASTSSTEAALLPHTSMPPAMSSISTPTHQNEDLRPTAASLADSPQQSTSAYAPRQAYRFKSTTTGRPIDNDVPEGPGRRLRKNVANVRKHIDYIANAINHIQARQWQQPGMQRRDRPVLQPDLLYHPYVLPPACTPEKPVDCVLTKFMRAAMNKVKCPIYSLCWTPEGKRLITGASSGEFTLWNGTAFNFETILQAHDVAIRAMEWSHNDQWLASADHDGFVKYWQPNFNNVHMFQAHKDEPIRSLSFCPTDVKLATGSDDATARVWDFARCAEERVLRGHGADVRSVDWHPTKGLLATGSRDSQQPVKLWDAKTGQCLATLHDHKNSVMAVQWNRNGNWLLTGSRDHVIKLYDVRMMKEVQSFRAHKKEVTSLAWHPIHESLFVSGGGDGALAYWLVNNDKELAMLEQAHDMAIWTLEWHPLGHILATGSNDNNTKFWARNRPGDMQEDVFGMTTVGGVLTGGTMANDADEHHHGRREMQEPEDLAQQSVPIPGLGIDESLRGVMNRDVSTAIPALMSLPGLGGSAGGGPSAAATGANAQPLMMPMGGTDGGRRPPPFLYHQQQQQQGGGRAGGPQPRKHQRQFERMWTVSRPGASAEFDEMAPPMFGGQNGMGGAMMMGSMVAPDGPGGGPLEGLFGPPKAPPRPLLGLPPPNVQMPPPHSHQQFPRFF